MKEVNAEVFTRMMREGIQPQGPFKNLRVAHTYMSKATGGTREQSVVCGNLSSPQGWVAVTTRSGLRQAHVIVEGQTVNNTWAFVIWLLQEQGNWRVQYFQFVTSAIVGKSAQDLWGMARTEQQRQHDFNAFVLYAAALQMAWRGPHLQLGILPELQKEMGKLRVPAELRGQPPFTWKFGESSFKVSNVGPIGIGGNIYLLITQEVGPWKEDKEAGRANVHLIAAFRKAYPEYSDVFAGLIVEARERGGARGYRTVEENPIEHRENGMVEPK